jgi:5-hydroxyisourate hydrolase-like protein (transthyretin family)
VVVLDPKTVTVTVDQTKPKATVSTGTVSLNSNYAETYETGFTVSTNVQDAVLLTAENHSLVKTDSTTTFAEPDGLKDDALTIATRLLENMKITPSDDGTAEIAISLKDWSADELALLQKSATYKYKLTPYIQSGGTPDAYSLAAVSFSVKIDVSMPTASAKVSGSLDLVKRSQGASLQFTLSKQPYDDVSYISSVKVYEGNSEKESDAFYANATGAAGKYILYLKSNADIATGKYNLRFEITTKHKSLTSDNIIDTKYTAVVNKVSVNETELKVSNSYTKTPVQLDPETGEVYVPLTLNDGLTLQSVTMTSAGNADYAKSIDGKLYYKNGKPYVHIWETGINELPKNTTITLTFSARAVGNSDGTKSTFQVKVIKK